MTAAPTRIERDTFGPIAVPADRLWGAQTQRSLEHFHISSEKMAPALIRALLMPGETDLYFRVADNAAELPFLAEAELKPIPSIWGHRAGNPATNPEDARFVGDAVRDWLAR